MNLALIVLSEPLVIARLDPAAAIPDWLGWSDPFLALVRTEDETSIICREGRVPRDVRAERGWRAI